jgi:uncharacterized YigZ family protein
MSSLKAVRTLKEPSESTYKEKGSEFIARAFPIKSADDVQPCIDETKKKYYDASHHCFALRLKDDSFRYSDAGEPGGTAGVRILSAIDHFELKDTLVIVTRYFGGVKLGAGKLGKAYYTSADLVLKASIFQEEKPFNRITIKCDFNHISLVHRSLSSYSALIKNIKYGNKAEFESLIPAESAQSFQNELTDSSSGEITTFMEKEIIYHII